MLSVPPRERKMLPAGAYRFVPDGFVYAGLHPRIYKGEVKGNVQLGYFRFHMEARGETYEKYQKFNLSNYSKSAMYGFISGLIGKPMPEDFIFTDVLGIPGRITYTIGQGDNGNEYLEMRGTSPLDIDDKPVVSPNPIQVFDWEKPLTPVADWVPGWLSQIVMDSLNWRGIDPKQDRDIKTGNTESGQRFNKAIGLS